MTVTEFLNKPRTPLEKQYLNGGISLIEFKKQREQEIYADVFKGYVIELSKLSFNPLRMPYKYLKGFVIRLMIGVAILAFTIGYSIAQPIVIYDNGKAIDAQQFYPFDKPSDDELSNISIPKPRIQELNNFPVITPELTVGKVKQKRIKYSIPRPICIIGDDKVSRRWLKINHAKLIEINALCMVINVSSRKKYRSLKNLANGIEIITASGADFRHQLNIKHYPVLIAGNVIVQ